MLEVHPAGRTPKLLVANQIPGKEEVEGQLAEKLGAELELFVFGYLSCYTYRASQKIGNRIMNQNMVLWSHEHH